jgi:hypothetical protein
MLWPSLHKHNSMTRVLAAASPNNYLPAVRKMVHKWSSFTGDPKARYENTVLWRTPNHDAQAFIQELLNIVLLHKHFLDPQLLHTMLEKAAVIQDDLCDQMLAPGNNLNTVRVNLHTLVTVCPDGPLASI